MTDRLLRILFPHDGHHVEGYHRELAQRMPARGRILDLGCGINTDLAPYRTPGREVWGADFQAHSHLRHAEWFRLLGSDGTIPFPDAHFDLVAASMVLEHVSDPEAFFREVARVLRPGGVFVGHTISGTHYVTWIRRAVGVLPHRFNQSLVRRLYGRDCEDTFPTHYALNTERAIRRASHNAGLRIAVMRRYADPGYFRFSAPLQACAVLLDRSLAWVNRRWGRLYLTTTLIRNAG